MYKITNDRTLLRGRPADTAHVLLLERHGAAVAWITIEEFATCPPELLGTLPATELVVTDLSFDPDLPTESVIELMRRALTTAPSGTAEYVRYRINPEFADNAERRRQVAAGAGMQLFQEKEGLHLDIGDVPSHNRLSFRSLDELGGEAFEPVVAAIGVGTLDRNDWWFHERAGATNWARVFLSMCAPEDRSSWLLGFDAAGGAVGFIGVTEMTIGSPTTWDVVPCGTIAMTGVVPQHRGQGYIDEILQAGIAAAKLRGFVAMLDTVDAVNGPMLAAMARCGYRADTRPWHDWFYRAPVTPV